MPEEKKFNYTQVTRYIYISTTLYSSDDMQKVLNLGIRADVDLELEKMDRPKSLTAYLWLPVKDFEAPSMEQFYLGVDFIDQLVRRKIKTLVHCNVGFGRAPTLVAAYLVAIKGKSLKKTITMISHKRPGVSPNRNQLEAIKKFVRSFRNSRMRGKAQI
ncbi:MAG: dual specificity protein phosphatase [bacterium]|nr:dual specificity protein phosphatase [bacterium]